MPPPGTRKEVGPGRTEANSENTTVTTTDISESSDKPRCRRCNRVLSRPVSVTRRCGWRCLRVLRAEGVAA